MLLGNFKKNCGNSSFWLQSDIRNKHFARTSVCSCIIFFNYFLQVKDTLYIIVW